MNSIFKVESLAPLLFLLMWSSGSIFVKSGLQESSVISFLLVRSAGSFIIILMIVSIFYRNKLAALTRIGKKELCIAMLTGLVLQCTYQSFYFSAIFYKASPGMLAIVLGFQPLLTPLLALENITKFGYFALLLGFTGLVFAVIGGESIGVITIAGLIFAGLAVLSMTIGTIIQKRSSIDILTSVLIQYAFSSVIFFIGVLYFGFSATPSLKFIYSSAWMILVVSVGAVMLLMLMLKKQRASSVSALFFLVPVITYFLDYIV